MRRLKLIHSDSGRVLGEILEMVQVEGCLEYVIQNEIGRFFVKSSNRLIVRH